MGALLGADIVIWDEVKWVRMMRTRIFEEVCAYLLVSRVGSLQSLEAQC